MPPQVFRTTLAFAAWRRVLWPVLAALFFAVGPVVSDAAVSPPNGTVITPEELAEATNHLGLWIWDTNTFDKQTCRLWRTFALPKGAKVSSAILRITVDNGFTLFLDGSQIGRGSDWRTVTEYDVTRLLQPGRHVLAVEGFNDRLAAGLIFGLHIEFANQPAMEILSDDSWSIVPNSQPHWVEFRNPSRGWHPAVVIGGMHHTPWEGWPLGLTVEPPLHPVIIPFWQKGWFQLSLLTICLLAMFFSVWLMTKLATQAKAQRVLQVERARIARDIHDDLGARLTQLVLLGEVAQRGQPSGSESRVQFLQICEQARELSQAMDEVVWAVNSRRDTIRDFVNYVCKYAQLYLSSTPIRCRLDVEPDIPADAFALPVRRNLFLAVKEALNNAAKYSGANELFLRIHRQGQRLIVTVEDNGKGFDPSQTGLDRNGLTNMHVRMSEIAGECQINGRPGGGCAVLFSVPLEKASRRLWRRAKEPVNPNLSNT